MGEALAKDLTPALFEGLCRIGDNALILGHRVSEWCGHGPALEEDIALANLALDLIGHAEMWLGLAGEVEGARRSSDDLAYLRDGLAFRNVLLVELPKGDMAMTTMRQFLFDVYHAELLNALAESLDGRMAEVAAKAAKEVAYHLERSSDLVVRLGDGSEESHRPNAQPNPKTAPDDTPPLSPPSPQPRPCAHLRNPSKRSAIPHDSHQTKTAAS